QADRVPRRGPPPPRLRPQRARQEAVGPAAVLLEHQPHPRRGTAGAPRLHRRARRRHPQERGARHPVPGEPAEHGRGPVQHRADAQGQRERPPPGHRQPRQVRRRRGRRVGPAQPRRHHPRRRARHRPGLAPAVVHGHGLGDRPVRSGRPGARRLHAAAGRIVMTRTLVICLLVTALLAGTGGCSLQTVGAPKGDMTLYATFDDVQSLVPGHSVQVADVRVGTVTGVRLDGYRARVTMSLRDDRRIPTGTTATIAKSSLLGENYVRLDLAPGRRLDTGPYLASGETIARTAVQPDLEQISAKVGPLLAALGGQDIATISGESATALGGRGRRLNTLVSRAADVGEQYAAASADLGRALDSLARLGTSLRAGSEEIDRLPGSVELATKRLQADRDNLRRTIEALLELATSVNANVQKRHAA